MTTMITSNMQHILPAIAAGLVVYFGFRPEIPDSAGSVAIVVLIGTFLWSRSNEQLRRRDATEDAGAGEDP